MRNIILMVLFLMSSLLGKAQVEITKGTLEKTYFATVNAEPLGLYLKFRSNGVRYVLSPDRVSNYNEVVHLHFGSSLRLQDKEGYLQLTPLPQPLTGFGFFVESQFDASSFGGTITKKEAIILIVPSIESTGVKSDTLELRFIEPDLKKAKAMLNL